jgi:hypothetical protein
MHLARWASALNYYYYYYYYYNERNYNEISAVRVVVSSLKRLQFLR